MTKLWNKTGVIIAILIEVASPSVAATTGVYDNSNTTITEHFVIVVDPHAQRAARVASLLWNCPSWIYEDDEYAKDFILRRLYAISCYDEKDIRAGVVWFLSDVEHVPYAIGAEERGKVALLSRLIFAVPESISLTESNRGMYTWLLPLPGGDKSGCSVPPLARRADGSIGILINLNKLSGDHPFRNVLSEFDYFSKRYGRSKLSLSPDGRIEREISQQGQVSKP
jgi:hypothetical protein